MLLEPFSRLSVSGIIDFFQPATINKLEYPEFKAKLKLAKHYRLVDVSNEEEFKQLHVPGALNINVQCGDFSERIGQLDKSKKYFIYCRNGMRSKIAGCIMVEAGFKHIYDLVGGIASWQGTLERSTNVFTA